MDNSHSGAATTTTEASHRLVMGSLRMTLKLLHPRNIDSFLIAVHTCQALFTSPLRVRMKFQLEYFLGRLCSVASDERVQDNFRLVAVEGLAVLWKFPLLINEIFANFDCRPYCSNAFEDVTKLLAMNSYPSDPQQSRLLLPKHLLCMDALLSVVDAVHSNCLARECAQLQQPQQQVTSSTSQQTAMRREMKRLINVGTHLFNENAKDGVEFLFQKGVFSSSAHVVEWFRMSEKLDRSQVAKYLCNRRNSEVLRVFAGSFQFQGLCVDEALRIYLETFRLPGESAEIEILIQAFAEQWFRVNPGCIESADAVFTLTYAILMLNVDQHNQQARRVQPPMTFEDFKRNLTGIEGQGDYNPEVLIRTYNSIRENEIVLPWEQEGPIKEDYMWREMLRKESTSEGVYLQMQDVWNELFSVLWSPVVTSLSIIFNHTSDERIRMRVLEGYRKCASIAAYYNMADVFEVLKGYLAKSSSEMIGGGVDEESWHVLV